MIEPSQMKAARALMGMSREELAEAASLSASTIQRLEEDPLAVSSRATQAVISVFSAHSIQLLQEDMIARGPGVAQRA